MTPVALESLLAAVCAWARARVSIRAVALVGSHARGTASAGSDVDLVILAESPHALLGDTSWTGEFGRPDRQVLEDWGRMTSVRVWYDAGPEVEFGISSIDWALLPDDGTLRVVRDGLRILLDRDGLFRRLLQG